MKIVSLYLKKVCKKYEIVVSYFFFSVIIKLETK